MSTLIYWQDADTGAYGVIRLDAVLSISPEDAVTITSHPVERGADVTDHARPEPATVSIEGVVSMIPNPAVDTDTGYQTIELSAPIRRATAQQTIALKPPSPPITPSLGGLVRAGIGALVNSQVKGKFSGATQPGTVTIKAQMLQQNSPRNRVRDVYEALLRVKDARSFVTVSTRDRDFFDMLIERVAEPRTAENGSSATFQIDFKQVRLASSKTVASPKPAEARGKKPVSKGSQAAAKPEPAKEEAYKSLSAAIFNALRGGPR